MFGRKNNGFTLIELLVVISIISLLSSVVLSSLNSARAKARDAKRVSDLLQLRTALYLYMNDNGGNLPTSYGSSAASGNNWNSTFITAMTPAYMSTLPIDPLPYNPTGYNYYAYYLTPGTISPLSDPWAWESQFPNNYDGKHPGENLPTCLGKIVIWNYPTENKVYHRECRGPALNFVIQ